MTPPSPGDPSPERRPMSERDLLSRLGWPAELLGELGSAHWSAAASDGFSMVRVATTRDSFGIRAVVANVSLEGQEVLLTIEAHVAGGYATELLCRYGEGHLETSAPAELDDALHLHRHMREGIGKMKFDSIGPVDLA